MLSMRIDCSTITFLFLTSVRYRIQSSVLLNFSPQNLLFTHTHTKVNLYIAVKNPLQ
jgi:hypothetical protein